MFSLPVIQVNSCHEQTIGAIDSCPCSPVDWLCGLGQVSAPLWITLYHLSQGVGVLWKQEVIFLGIFLGLGSLGLQGCLGPLWNPHLFPHRRSSRAGSRGTSLLVADLSSSLMRWTSCPLA